jgi:hypothetical protein
MPSVSKPAFIAREARHPKVLPEVPVKHSGDLLQALTSHVGVVKLHRHCGVPDIVHSLFDGDALGVQK